MQAHLEAQPDRVVRDIIDALRRESPIDLDRHPIQVRMAGGRIVLEGEVPNMRAKRLAVTEAALVPGAAHVVDHLSVPPAAPMEDEAIRDHVQNVLLEEPSLVEHGLRAGAGDGPRVARTGWRSQHDILVEVKDGVVRLSGGVAGLGHRRLAGVLAWWVPGTRDVLLDLDVMPPEEDTDMEITDAIRLVHEKDPLVNASQLRVMTVVGIVHLKGLVRCEEERDAAELDALYVDGVRDVVNHIELS